MRGPTRLVLLDSRQFSLLNGIDKDTREAIRQRWESALRGCLCNGPPLRVFAVVNTQKRGVARGQAFDLSGVGPCRGLGPSQVRR